MAVCVAVGHAACTTACLLTAVAHDSVMEAAACVHRDSARAPLACLLTALLCQRRVGPTVTLAASREASLQLLSQLPTQAACWSAVQRRPAPQNLVLLMSKPTACRL